MLLTKEVTMNLNFRESPIVLEALQGDSARALTVHFYVGETPWEIPGDANILLQYCCEDGTGSIYDTLPDGTSAWSVDGNALTIHLISQVCAVPGCTRVQVTIFSGDKQVSAFPIEIRVTGQVTGEPVDATYCNLRQWLISYVHQDAFITAVLEALPDGDEVTY